jgi:hypothetical protein
MQGECQLLLIRQLLVAKHQHGVFIHARVNRRDLVRRKRLAAINTCHLAGEDWRELFD